MNQAFGGLAPHFRPCTSLSPLLLGERHAGYSIVTVGWTNQHGFDAPVNFYGEHRPTVLHPPLTHTIRLK